MGLSGTKLGSFNGNVNCGGINGSFTINVSGASNPLFGINAPAAFTGVNTAVLTGASGYVNVDDPNKLLTVAGESSFEICIFWTDVTKTILYACYDFQYSAVSYSTVSGVNVSKITVAGGGVSPTSAKYFASSGTVSALPADGTAVAVVVSQDITDGVSITGANIQQLLATSNQIGLIEWVKASATTQERLSAILAANVADTWPVSPNQIGQLPSGGGGLNWTSGDTVGTLRCYNLGCPLANIGVSPGSTAVMQASVILS